MLAGMNGLDYAIIAIVAVVALHGFTRGAIRMATSIVSLIAGIYLASVYYGRAAQIAATYLKTGPALSQAIGYAGVFGIVFIGIEYAGGRATRIVRAIHLSWADRAAGALLGASLGAIIAGLIVLGLTAAMPDNSPVLAGSKLAPKVLRYNQMLLAYVPPQVKEEYERKRGELLRKWAQEMENPGAPRHPAAAPGSS
jgi:membrane protein required for colicin V production